MRDERMEKVETKVAYLERTVSELNDIVIDLGREMGTVRNQVERLRQKVIDLMEEAGEERPNRTPPHY